MATNLTPEELDKLEAHYHQLVAKRQDILDAQNPPSVIEEMHPSISTGDRAVIKNFSNGEEGAQNNIDYLKQMHPELDVRAYKGRILARGPKEKEYRVLDPNTGFFSKDIGHDALDVAGDVGKGILEGAGTALGGAAGALAGLPAGPAGVIAGGFAGKSAAGAATAGSLEYLRQRLGQALGVNKNVDMGQVKADAAVNGALPALGALGKGVYNVGSRYIAPTFASISSGVPTKVIKNTAKYLPEIDAVENTGLTDYAQQAYSKLVQPIIEGTQAKGQELADAIKGSGKSVDVSGAKQSLQNLIDQYKQSQGSLNNPNMKQSIASLEGTYKNLFSSPEKSVLDMVEGKSPEETAKILESLGKLETVAKNAAPEYETANVAPKKLSPYLTPPPEVAPPPPPLNQSTMDVVTKEIPNQLPADAAWELQKQMSHAAEMHKLGAMQAAVSPRTAGKTIPAKQAIMALDSGYDSIGQGLDAATDGLSPALKGDYQDYSKLKRLINGHFNTPQATYSTLTNLDKKSKTALREALDAAKDKYGVDIGKEADVLQAQAWMGDKKPGGLSYWPISSGGVTSTARALGAGGIGSAIGSGLDHTLFEDPDSNTGKYIGGTLGMLAGGPKAVKAMIRAGVGAENLASKVPTAAAYGIPSTIWELMKNKKQEGQQ